MTIDVAGEPILEDADLGAVRLLHPCELGHDALGKNVDDVALGVALLEQRPEVGGARAHDTGREQPAPHRQEVRDERHREAEPRRDLRRMLVLAHAVRRDVLENGSGMRRRARRAARARHPRLRVDDDAGRLDRARRSGRGRGGLRSRSSPDWR